MERVKDEENDCMHIHDECSRVYDDKRGVSFVASDRRKLGDPVLYPCCACPLNKIHVFCKMPSTADCLYSATFCIILQIMSNIPEQTVTLAKI